MDKKMLGIGSRVNHPSYGDGVVVAIDTAAYKVVFIEHGEKHIGLQYEAWTIRDAVEALDEVVFDKVEKSLIKVLRKWSDISSETEMHTRWEGGTLFFQPGDATLKGKELPIETFFHKIVMVRDRLRVMEQRINSSKNLSESEKANLQQYLTRIYGSLTTFNVFFDDSADNFVGEKSK